MIIIYFLIVTDLMSLFHLSFQSFDRIMATFGTSDLWMTEKFFLFILSFIYFCIPIQSLGQSCVFVASCTYNVSKSLVALYAYSGSWCSNISSISGYCIMLQSICPSTWLSCLKVSAWDISAWYDSTRLDKVEDSTPHLRASTAVLCLS